VGGYVDTPPNFGGVPALSNFLSAVLPPLEEIHGAPITETITALSASLSFALGLFLAYMLFGPQRERRPAENPVERFWLNGWGFDSLYHAVFVRPFQLLTRSLARDPADLPVQGMAQVTVFAWQALRLMQTGSLRWYATSLAMGTIVLLAIAFLVH
jgi:NADH-quinone oxidoreductase subunit L